MKSHGLGHGSFFAAFAPITNEIIYYKLKNAGFFAINYCFKQLVGIGETK
jgi:hypothetical protein